jgi:hypothetical protein
VAPIGAVITVVAALAFALAGLQMVTLRSEAGNTIAELFDQGMGVACFGMAGLTLLAGIAVDRLMLIARQGKTPGAAADKPPVNPVQ